jgi:hypothetical protein
MSASCEVGHAQHTGIAWVEMCASHAEGGPGTSTWHSMGTVSQACLAALHGQVHCKANTLRRVAHVAEHAKVARMQCKKCCCVGTVCVHLTHACMFVCVYPDNMDQTSDGPPIMVSCGVHSVKHRRSGSRAEYVLQCMTWRARPSDTHNLVSSPRRQVWPCACTQQ